MMRTLFIFIASFAFAQNSYEGEITFDYTGTVNGNFSSIVQDSIQTGFLYNQTGLDTSYVIMGALTQQGDDEFDLFFAFLRDTIYPVQPRTWSIPGEGDEEDPTNLENIVVLLEGLDSSTVVGLFNALSDSSTLDDDSLSGDSLISIIFGELSENLYFGIAGEIEISMMTDSTIDGSINTTMLKPEFQIPPHVIMINNGSFNFQSVDAPVLIVDDEISLPISVSLLPAYPNPFNPSTTVTVETEQNETVQISIFNINGQLVSTLHSGYLPAGKYKYQWDGTSNPSGLYFAKLMTKNFSQTTKLLLMK